MKVGVIGAGAMGENHVRVYKSLSDHCQLVGIYDIDENRSKEVAEKYQINHFINMESLLTEVDAVSIAVPTEYHYEVGLICIAYKVNMLMEKPITHNLSEAVDLIEKSDNMGVKLQVGHIELFNPTINILKEILTNEKIIAVDVHRLSPFDPRIIKVDVVKDLMIHDLYILNYLLNDEIEQFHAFGKVYEETIKHAIVVSKYKKGVIAQTTASFKTEEKVRTIRIATEDAFIQVDLLDKKILISRSTNFFLNKFSVNYSQQNMIEKVLIPQQEPLKAQLIDFLHCVKNNSKPTVTGEDGTVALSISDQISKTIMDNNKINKKGNESI